jgi:teichuronic acid biosynthesis glycosyltransferase TuaG
MRVTPDEVSVVIAHHNSSGTIREAVASVLSQTTPPAEVIVVDDASHPAERARLGELLPSDVRIVDAPRNLGVGGARQLGTEAASRPWLAYLDADDVWLPTKLERQLAFLDQHPTLDGTHCGTIVWRNGVDAERYVTKPARLTLEGVCRMDNILASAFLIRAEALRRVGGWSSQRLSLDDWDLCFRLTLAGAEIGFQPEALVRFRRDGHGNMTSDPWHDLVLHLGCIELHRATIRDTIGAVGLAKTRADCLLRFARRQGGLAGRLLAWGSNGVLGRSQRGPST